MKRPIYIYKTFEKKVALFVNFWNTNFQPYITHEHTCLRALARRHTRWHTKPLACSGQRLSRVTISDYHSGTAGNSSLLGYKAVPTDQTTHIYKAIWFFETSKAIHPTTMGDNWLFSTCTSDAPRSNFISLADLLPHVFGVIIIIIIIIITNCDWVVTRWQ